MARFRAQERRSQQRDGGDSQPGGKESPSAGQGGASQHVQLAFSEFAFLHN
jgi:hypothetical protein